MLKEYTTKANIGILGGLVLQFSPLLLLADQPDRSSLNTFLAVATAARLAGLALIVWGCCNYMLAKGYHWAFGFFGLLSLLGLIILVCFPDKCKNGVRPQQAQGFEVLRPGQYPAGQFTTPPYPPGPGGPPSAPPRM